MFARHRAAGRLTGLKAVRFTVELLRRGVARLLREAPDAIRAAKIDALLVDQADLPAARVIQSKVKLRVQFAHLHRDRRLTDVHAFRGTAEAAASATARKRKGGSDSRLQVR
jgi:hypothetical protein